MKNYPKVAVVVPVFNEATIIANVLKDILEYAKRYNLSIFVVNDGSIDDTLSKLKNFNKKINIISYVKNQGKGYALRTGTKEAIKKGNKIIVWIDGDGQLNAADILKMLDVLDDETDMVIHDRNINFKVLPTSKIGRASVRFLFNMLFGGTIHDHLSGLKAFHAKIFPIILWQADDYCVEIEIIARAVFNNLKIKEIRGHCNKKLYTGISWQAGLKIYYWIFWSFFNKGKFIKK
jgi:glycosyltransferase involved in cell wall biosynthesis